MTADPFEMLPLGDVRRFHVAAGAVIFRAGDADTALFRVDSGRLALVRVTEDGHRITVAQAGPGDTLAEASLFADRYHCDCLALTETRGLRAPARQVRAALRSAPDFAEAMVKSLAVQVREERQRTAIMSIRSARERTFAALASFGQPGSVTDLASGIGLTQEACSRALAALVAEGRVDRIARGRYACRTDNAPRQ